MSGQTLGFPLPLSVILGPWVLPKETLKAGHSRSPGVPRLPPGEIPFGRRSACLGTQRAREAVPAAGLCQVIEQTSLVTEPAPGDT